MASGSATERVLGMGESARGLVDAAWLWLTRDPVAALVAFGAAVAIFAALTAARRLFAPASAEGSRELARPARPGSVAHRVVERTKDYFLAMLSLELVARFVDAPALLLSAFGVLFTIAAVLQGAVWLRALALALIERRAARGEDAGQLASAMGIVRVLLTAVIWGLALILVLDNLGVNVTALVAGLGVGGIAIGLAAQGIFSDLFAALSIIFDRPFAKGDQINFGDTYGQVEAIGLKTTRIRSLTGEQIVVSNANLLGKELRNFARLERRRATIAVGIVYQTGADQAEHLPDEFRRIVEADPICRMVRSGLTAFGASSLDFEIQLDVTTDSYDTMYAQRHRIMVGIMRRFGELGIEFAYPTTVLFTAAPDGRAIDPREPVTASSSVPAIARAVAAR